MRLAAGLRPAGLPPAQCPPVGVAVPCALLAGALLCRRPLMMLSWDRWPTEARDSKVRGAGVPGSSGSTSTYLPRGRRERGRARWAQNGSQNTRARVRIDGIKRPRCATDGESWKWFDAVKAGPICTLCCAVHAVQLNTSGHILSHGWATMQTFVTHCPQRVQLQRCETVAFVMCLATRFAQGTRKPRVTKHTRTSEHNCREAMVQASPSTGY